MSIMLKFIFALLLLPLLELYLLIVIGSGIGAATTVLLTLGTAVLGVWLVRLQGINIILRAQAEIHSGETPALPMLEGGALCVAGILLLVPGFATDTLGFLMLVSPLRRWLLNRWLNRISRYHYQPSRSSGRIIDVQFEESDRKDHP